MNRPERIYRIKNLLQQHGVVSKQRLLEDLEISLATFKRDLAYMRDRMNAPVEYVPDAGGYRLAKATGGHELPGLWFNADEIHALLTMEQLLKELRPGLLTPHVKPLLDRLYKLMDYPAAPRMEVQRRIRLLQANARHVESKAFDLVSTAVLNRRRITIQYFHRSRNAIEPRKVSPQRLTYYRDNWYLDAWCHLREGIRCFSLDAVQSAELTDEAALNVPDAELDAVFNASYGIFSGIDVEWAVLRFSPEKARWVSRELWHPQQKGEFEPSGHYLLRVPYSDDRELTMDILRHVPEVTVLAPESLQLRIRTVLKAGLMATEHASSDFSANKS